MKNLFQKNGTLAPGVFQMKLLLFRRIFVKEMVGSFQRKPIFKGFLDYLRIFKEHGILHSALVDGSFVTKKINPNDIDVSIIFDAQKAEALNPDITLKLCSMDESQQYASIRKFYTHPCFNVPYYPPNHPGHNFSKHVFCKGWSWWGRDREKNPKGMILIPFTKNAVSEIGGLMG
ncbi:MAG: DUF6932 family protein [Aminivibrio sp.]